MSKEFGESSNALNENETPLIIPLRHFCIYGFNYDNDPICLSISDHLP